MAEIPLYQQVTVTPDRGDTYWGVVTAHHDNGVSLVQVIDGGMSHRKVGDVVVANTSTITLTGK